MKALELPGSMINEFRERTLIFQDLDEGSVFVCKGAEAKQGILGKQPEEEFYV